MKTEEAKRILYKYLYWYKNIHNPTIEAPQPYDYEMEAAVKAALTHMDANPTNKLPKGFTVRQHKLVYNNVEIGVCYREVDGEYVFWPDEKKGFMNTFILRKIAEVLDQLNQTK